MLDPRQTVANLVLDHSECAPVFQRHRIDFCCRGDLSIAAACQRAGVDSQLLLEELSRAIAARSPLGEPDPRALSTPALIEHIIIKHHGYLREVLPFVQSLAAKVARVHGDHNPKLRELAAVVNELHAQLVPHLDFEEQSLFPLLAAEHVDLPRVEPALRAMHEEHLQVAALLERMREASDDYGLPDWACNSYRTLGAELAALETDVFAHVHLENHVLMPRFAGPEAA